MSEKTLRARLVNKHDIEVNWLKSSFIPMKGELVVFDIEVDADGNTLELPEGRTAPYLYERFKIGDGEHNVNDLPFATDGYISYDTEQTLTDEQKAQVRANISKYDWRDVTIANQNYTIADYSPANYDSYIAQSTFDIDAALACTGVVSASYSSIATIAHMANMLFGGALQGVATVKTAIKNIAREYDNLKTNGIIAETGLIYICHKGTNDNIKVAYYIGVADGEHVVTICESQYGYAGNIRYNSETDTYNTEYFTGYADGDKTLTYAGMSADSKAVGDALATKQDKDLIINITSSTVDGETVFTADKTFAEIKTAISEGKSPVMLSSGMRYDLSYDSSTTIGFTFVRNMNNVLGDMTVVQYFSINNNDVITRQNNQIQCSSAKVSTLSSDADHSHYPSAKAVVDYAAAKTDLDEVSALVGDTPVASQISEAITNSVADWSQTDSTAPDYIKNKPEIATNDEIIALLAETDMLPVVAEADGSILGDENENILLW